MDFLYQLLLCCWDWVEHRSISFWLQWCLQAYFILQFFVWSSVEWQAFVVLLSADGNQSWWLLQSSFCHAGFQRGGLDSDFVCKFPVCPVSFFPTDKYAYRIPCFWFQVEFVFVRTEFSRFYPRARFILFHQFRLKDLQNPTSFQYHAIVVLTHCSGIAPISNFRLRYCHFMHHHLFGCQIISINLGAFLLFYWVSGEDQKHGLVLT